MGWNAGLEPTGQFAHVWVLETYRSLTPVERIGGQFVGALVAAVVLLGLVQEHSSRAIAKSRRSPIISSCLGFPSLLVVLTISSTGYLILGSSLGTFFGVIFVVFGITVIPVAAVVGLVAIGQSMAARFGRDTLWFGVLCGSLVCGLAGLSLAVTVVLVGTATTLGLGTLVRILLGPGGTTSPEDRSVPPANKI
ncbi:hypothetical protein EA462_05395 [Natrarchaeobius halalkaliphilus]|uniref:Uncharacterized protein n=1 Tax=Natrarchaeobius halalkaliphilus TaxID=1679091 RepID=A0A3N6LSA0_9EURY|nr:hypothetical protein [Natrarchaeobius halalkaliphilus]RQG91407.1 hypothetical protein EA462_05395 [Natrarchaeobius halalkaliphilus]